MRKEIIFILLIALILSGCGVEEENVSTTTKEQEQKLNVSSSLNKKEFSSGDTLILTVHNNEPLQGRTIEFGQPYTTEYLQEGEWIEAKWLYPGVWVDIAYVLVPGKSFNQSIELFPVKEGNYRISKKVYAEGENPLKSEGVVLMETFKVIKGTPEEEVPKAELPEHFWRELENYCNRDLPENVSRKDVAIHLKNLISDAVHEVDPKHKIFIYYGGLYQTSIGVKHATREFVEKWPDVCHGVEIKVEVFSWALTENNTEDKIKLDFTTLTDEDIVSYALRNDDFSKKYRGWKFNITGKSLVERGNVEMLYVDMWVYRGGWEQANHVWFYLNEKGELVDLNIYPYIKTTHPSGVSPEEGEEMLSLAMNDSEVRDAIAGREYQIWQMVKYVNPFTGEEKSKQIYIKINDSPLTYIISIKDSNVSIENTTCPSGEGFCFGEPPAISIEELPTPEGYHD